MIVLHTTLFSGLGTGGGGPVSVMKNLKNARSTRNIRHIFLYSFATGKTAQSEYKSKLFNLINMIRSKLKISETAILFLLLIKYTFRLDYFLKNNKVDIIHFHDVLSAYIFISFFKKNTFYPKTVLTIQSVGPFYNEFPLFSGEKLSKIFLKRMEEMAIRGVDALTFPSRGAKIQYLKFVDTDQRSELRRKISIIYNAIDTNSVKSAISISNIVKERVYNPKGRYNILTVSRLHYTKGVDRLPEIANALRKCNFCLVGNGNMKGILLKKTHKYKIENLVLIDKMQHDLLLKLISSSDLFLMLSRSTVFDLVMLEAMCLGKIVLATDIAGHDEMITNGVNGYLTSIDKIPQSIQKISKFSRAKRRLIETAARSTVHKFFSPSSIMKSYENLYIKLKGDTR